MIARGLCMLGCVVAQLLIVQYRSRPRERQRGCGKEALLDSTIVTTTAITMFLGSDDEEVPPQFCQHVAERSKAAGTPIDALLYPGATHDFDDPGEKRQSIPGNVAAKADAMSRVTAIVKAAGD